MKLTFFFINTFIFSVMISCGYNSRYLIGSVDSVIASNEEYSQKDRFQDSNNIEQINYGKYQLLLSCNNKQNVKTNICLFKYLNHPGLIKIHVSEKSKGRSLEYNFIGQPTINDNKKITIENIQDGIYSLILYNKVSQQLHLIQRRNSGPRQTKIIKEINIKCAHL